MSAVPVGCSAPWGHRMGAPCQHKRMRSLCMDGAHGVSYRCIARTVRRGTPYREVSDAPEPCVAATSDAFT
jgi:hypothetical protein